MAQVQNNSSDVLLCQLAQQPGHVNRSALRFAGSLASFQFKTGIKRRQIDHSETQRLAVGAGQFDDFGLGLLVLQLDLLAHERHDFAHRRIGRIGWDDREAHLGVFGAADQFDHFV